MKVVIVCESMFGNTEVLAAAVERGMKLSGAEGAFAEVGEAYEGHWDFTGCDLLASL